MSFLHTLRRSPWLAKLALLWYALTLGVAVASPMVNPQEEVLICTAMGMVKVTLNNDGSISTTASAEAKCPLCVSSAAPPSVASILVLPDLPGAPRATWQAESFVHAHRAAPPPPRGPPVQA